MSLTFNANEIFEMAEEIERNGAKFYRKAAEGAKDADTQKYLIDMAVMEDGHLEIFQHMRQKLSDGDKVPITYDPGNEAALYLQTMADARGYEGKISPALELTGKESMEDVLQIAITAERNSVVFYVGLKTLVKSDTGKEQVDKIIGEEMAHIATLQKKLLSLQ
ncbi:ferritin family protein [Planctomycetota bacterium]